MPGLLCVLQAVVGGTASSGVIICCLRILTKATLPATRAGLHQSTSIYFAMSGVICLLCWCIYYAVLPRLAVVRHFRQKSAGGKQTGPLTLLCYILIPQWLCLVQTCSETYGPQCDWASWWVCCCTPVHVQHPVLASSVLRLAHAVRVAVGLVPLEYTHVPVTPYRCSRGSIGPPIKCGNN